MRRVSFRGWIAVWIGAVLALGTFGAQPSYAQTAGVENPVVNTGSTLVVRASGFNKGERIVTWVSSARGSVYATESVDADNRGDVTVAINVKRFWEPGYWAVTVHGLRSDREAVATFQVQTGPPDGALALSSPTVAPGSTLGVRGEGFDDGELVSAWVTRPDGTTDKVPTSPLTPNNGRVDFIYELPLGAQLGTWSVTAYGNNSELILIAPFTVAR
jgi:hypothetical protein